MTTLVPAAVRSSTNLRDMMVPRLVHLRHDADAGRGDRYVARAGPARSICFASRSYWLNGQTEVVAAKFGVERDALRCHWEGVTTDRKNYLRMGRQLSQKALVEAKAEEKVSASDHLRIARAGLAKCFSTLSR